MSKIDLAQLAKEIKTMTRQHDLYKVLKSELSKRGWWRNRERGNPAKAYRVSKGLE